jgi:hypothetical protein
VRDGLRSVKNTIEDEAVVLVSHCIIIVLIFHFIFILMLVELICAADLQKLVASFVDIQ